MMARPPSPEDLLGGPRPDEPDAPGGGGLPWRNPTLMGASSGGGSGLRYRALTTETMSWEEWRSYQKGGANWGGNTRRGGAPGGIIRIGTGAEAQTIKKDEVAGVETVDGVTRAIPAGTNLGEHFYRQQAGAYNQMANWIGWFFREAIITIASPYVAAGLFEGLRFARIGIQGRFFRWGTQPLGKVRGFENWDIFGYRLRINWGRADWHIYSVNWYRRGMWAAENQRITMALLRQAQTVNYSLVRLVALVTSPFRAPRKQSDPSEEPS
jgi:hypothetical protein